MGVYPHAGVSQAWPCVLSLPYRRLFPFTLAGTSSGSQDADNQQQTKGPQLSTVGMSAVSGSVRILANRPLPSGEGRSSHLVRRRALPQPPAKQSTKSPNNVHKTMPICCCLFPRDMRADIDPVLLPCIHPTRELRLPSQRPFDPRTRR